MPETTPLQDWAASGAMALTGRAEGPPQAAPGAPARMVRGALARFKELTTDRTGIPPELPGIGLLGERAAIAGLRRNAPFSCGGAFRFLPTQDGFLGLSLPRPDDFSLLPALIEQPVDADPWTALGHWAADRTGAEAADRTRLLGLACAIVPGDRAERPPVLVTEVARRATRRERPRIVDLTSSWAGPLCAHLLGLTGAEVIKVESLHHPDSARSGPTAFFDLLHAGHAMVGLDFGDPADLAALHDLVAGADLVLEASRSSELRQLGLVAENLVAHGTSWLSITAHGRDSDTIGFGDDVAADAGLVAWSGGEPIPCGDALADPLTGVAAAVAAGEALLSPFARLVDVSMYDVARTAAAGAPEPHDVRHRGGEWWVTTDAGDFPVADPAARPPTGRAGGLGEHTRDVLG